MTKMLDRIEQILRGDAPPPPVAKLIGFELISVKPGEAVIEFQATEAHANPMVHSMAVSSATLPTLQWVLPIHPILAKVNPSRRLNSRSTS